VIVKARVLLVRPADQPDVDVRVAVELEVEALVWVVADQRPQDVFLASELERELTELVTCERAVRQ
jgi:hypothetical protein